MNLRSFVPPAALPTSKPPELGEPAPELPGLSPGRPAVVAFLRHTGCPFAEATMVALRGAAAASGDGLDWIAVSHAPADATERWVAAVGGIEGVRVLPDPERRLYGAWGLGRTSLGHFMGRRSLSAVMKLARQGIRNRHPDGTRWQQAGTFLVDADGAVRWRHLPAHAGELPDLAAVGQIASRAR
jgi:hypothetical protein